MKKLKTIDDLMDLKNNPCPPFENAYVFFFRNLENNYISKINGDERNKAIISEYDDEAQAFIKSKINF